MSGLYGTSGKAKAKKLYKLLVEELRCRIAEIQKNDANLIGEPDEIIGLYTSVFLDEMKQRRKICSKNSKWADFYFLSRVIGSCTNAREKRNVFKSYFGDFLHSEDIKSNIELPWMTKREAMPNEYGYWDYMFQLLQSGQLSDDRSGLSQILFEFEVEKIAHADKSELLESFRCRAKSNVKIYNDALWEKADEIPFEPKKYICNTFREGGLFSILADCLVKSCDYVCDQGGSARWLSSLDKKLDVRNPNVKDNADELCKETDEWPGYGPALSEDFFKDMGFDFFGKPDRHVITVLQALNIPLGDKPEENVNNFLNHFAHQVGSGVSANQIDKIIWLLMSGRFYKHTTKAYPLNTQKEKSNSFKMCRRILKKLK